MYWNDRGRKELEKALKISTTINTNIAKNIILFIGDGMSLATLTAARIYKAQAPLVSNSQKESCLFSIKQSQ